MTVSFGSSLVLLPECLISNHVVMFKIGPPVDTFYQIPQDMLRESSYGPRKGGAVTRDRDPPKKIRRETAILGVGLPRAHGISKSGPVSAG